MAVIDTLKILVEADASGLETQLKKGMQTISSFVSQADSQQLNWQKILAGSLDTAIISGIAASFAVAIEQAVSFQSSLLNLNNSASGTSGAIDAATGSISDGLVNAANQAGASLGDTASAYEALYKQIGDSGGAEKLTGQIGALALELGTNLGSLMPQIIELFNQWGVNSLPQAEAAITGLFESAGKGKFTLNELLSTISQQGPILQAKTNISDLALQMQALSNVSGLSKTVILDTLNSIAQGVSNPSSNIDVLNGGIGEMGKLLSGPDGVVKAFETLSTNVKAFGPIVSQQMGLSQNAVAQFGKVSGSSLKDAKTATDNMRGSLVDLDAFIKSHESTTTKFQQDWATITNILGQHVGVPILETIIKEFDIIGGLFSSAKTGGFVGFLEKIGSDFSAGLSSALSPASHALSALQNKPGANSQSSSMGPVTLNTTVNIAASTTNSNPQAVGNGIGTSLYDSFTGLLSKLHL